MHKGSNDTRDNFGENPNLCRICVNSECVLGEILCTLNSFLPFHVTSAGQCRDFVDSDFEYPEEKE